MTARCGCDGDLFVMCAEHQRRVNEIERADAERGRRERHEAMAAELRRAGWTVQPPASVGAIEGVEQR